MTIVGEIVIRLTESQVALVRESLERTMENFRAYPYQDEQTRRERMEEARAILAAIKTAKADARERAS